ncbi:9dad758c-46d2-4744-a013-f5a868cf44a7 [Sclerotinia trifoliorum]|uniref:9dad758c-46d2-4744-a013-f5a868cf44a7 n=1 Tax=Sclerotinia trifoliorum TaxID=28548 RepID=A0A8H2ZVG0_9HELO|nr:9dad758c-46d2-4744-a013-f5a868cf44a7 [Sclerotinia trifoliorum]
MLLTTHVLIKRPKPPSLNFISYFHKHIKMGWRDEWPSGLDGNQYDGQKLMDLVRNNKSPFHEVWDVKLLIREIEENLNTQVTDIPIVDKGSNNYGFYIKASNRPDMVARLARGDVNMPDFDGFPIEKQAPEALFEAATYELLRSESDIRTSRLLYYRVPVRHPGPRLTIPLDLTGRRLFVFERAEGTNNMWEDLSAENKLVLLDQLACMRAALFRYDPPLDFCVKYLHDRIFDFKPESFSVPVAPTREFWMHVLESKIKATIQNEGDMIGWEDDAETVGPIALTAKQSLLRAIPHIMPPESTEVSLYRLILEHGDFGIHNTSITKDDNGKPLVTSLYDWETACIVPALLSDPLVAAGPVDLITDKNGGPSVTRIPKNSSLMDLEMYEMWAQHYIKKLYNEAPDYEIAIRAGKDVRYLWFSLRDWRGGNSEEFFGDLGAWAEKRMKELGVF